MSIEEESYDEDEMDSENIAPSTPGLTHFKNLLASVPTDEDLRRSYFWQTRRLGGVERNEQSNTKRVSRLKTLWRALWYGNMHLKISSSELWEWKSIFVVVQGHRFVWWESTFEFDEGNKPLGEILFAGHSGVTQLSPLDLRQLNQTEQDLAFCVFGRGNDDQKKITLLADTLDEKLSLTSLIFEMTTDPKND